MHPKKRDRLLMAMALAVSLAGTGAIVANYGAKQAPDVQTIDVWAGHPPEDGRWSVQFLGDTMVGNGETPMVDPLGFDAALAGVVPLIDGDFVIANAEAPITTHNEPLIPGKPFVYRSEPQAAWALLQSRH